MKILVTSGGTRIPIDPVRYIGNCSRGKTGAAIVDEALLQLHDVTMLRAKHSEWPRDYAHPNCQEIQFETFEQYNERLTSLLTCGKKFDAVLLAAAVSDYGVVPSETKIRTSEELTIQLYKLPKVIETVKKLQPETFLVGFKLLVDSTWDEQVKAAREQIARCGSDLVWVNDLNNYQYETGFVTKDECVKLGSPMRSRIRYLFEKIECGISSSRQRSQ